MVDDGECEQRKGKTDGPTNRQTQERETEREPKKEAQRQQTVMNLVKQITNNRDSVKYCQSTVSLFLTLSSTYI